MFIETIGSRTVPGLGSSFILAVFVLRLSSSILNSLTSSKERVQIIWHVHRI
jgi:hypothetical protein